jgi:hypothetical protein
MDTHHPRRFTVSGQLLGPSLFMTRPQLTSRIPVRNIHPHSERDSVAPSEKECTRAPCDDGNRGGAGQLSGAR